MTISLEAIRFNHDRDLAISAFTIRRNQIGDVTAPEWRRGMTARPTDSPAAYSIRQISANRLTIRAQFRREDGDPMSVVVNAVGRTGNVLGNVRSRTIRFTNDLSDFELFELDLPGGNPGVGVRDISWDWSVGGNLQTTQHRIYTILDAPQPPWGQPGSSFRGFQLPWTDVLEHACLAAAGARNVDEAADRLTRWVYSLGGSKLKYNDQGFGSSCFIIGGMDAFKCTDFLQALANGHGSRETVNCIDCATILSSFANILGCNLSQSQIGFEFQTNLVQKIGASYYAAQPFRFHEVAWKFPNGGNPTVFDCCLQIDGDRNLNDDNFSPILGINFPMGDPKGTAYHGRLIKPTSRGRRCKEWPSTRKRRQIENGGILRRIEVEPTQRLLLEEEYEFSTWAGVEPKPDCEPRHGDLVVAPARSSTSDQSLFLKNYSFRKDETSPVGWVPSDVKSYKAEPDPVRVTEVVWLSEGCSGAALRVLTYECLSVASARSFLLGLLAEFHLPGIKRRREFVVGDKQVTIGDVAFSGLDELVLLFARANNVIFIQNVGQTSVSVSQFAHELDTDMGSNPEPKKVLMDETEQFEICDKVSVGNEIPIQDKTRCVSREKETLFKFFAPAGQVFQKGDHLSYRPLVAGEQCITVLAFKTGGEITRQDLKLFAEPPASLQETPCQELTKPNREEKRVMLDKTDLTGVWSSITPTSDGIVSSDMNVDAYIEIKKTNPDTGEITGYYRDQEPRSETELLTGRVIFLDSRFYITLSHPNGEGVTRHYEGQLVATDGAIQIVAGNYHDEIGTNGSAGTLSDTTAGDSVRSLDGGQYSGTWVATKP